MDKQIILQSLPRVQTLAESGIQTVPPQYVRPRVVEAWNPQSHDHAHAHDDDHVPVIDLQGIRPLQQQTVAEISSAAQNWGFFQIVNHGIPDSVITRVQAMGSAFFHLPLHEKELCKNEEAGSPIGYGSKVGYSPDAKLDWGDYYYNVVLPSERRNMSKWPKQPSDFTQVMDEYGREICKLWEVLMQALSRGLGLEDENALNQAVGGEEKEIHFRINYYPPCPQPELVLGISPHSDPNVLTILLHDQTPGLQIQKDGDWKDVECVPGALVVNIGDALEIISNGKYKSIEHRSLVHRDRARMSWAMFGVPPLNEVIMISPLKELTDKGDPPLYKGSSWKEYLQRFFVKGLDGKGHVHELHHSPIPHSH